MILNAFFGLIDPFFSMNPKEFNTWVTNLNQSQPGDGDVSKEIENFMKNPNLNSLLIDLISSNDLTNEAIFFAIKMLTSPNIAITEEERAQMRNFFSFYIKDNSNRFYNANFLKDLTLLFMKAFFTCQNEGLSYIEGLSNSSDRNMVLLSFNMLSNIIEIHHSSKEYPFIPQIAVSHIISDGDDELVFTSLNLLEKCFQYAKTGKEVNIPVEFIEPILENGGPHLFLNLIHEKHPPISTKCIEILILIFQSPPSTLPNQEVRENFLNDVISTLPTFFENHISDPEDMVQYIDLCKVLKKKVLQIKIPTPKVKKFLEGVATITAFLLTTEQMELYPHRAELILDFWRESLNVGVERVERRIILRIITIVLKYILSNEASEAAIEPLILDGSSNFLNYFSELAVKDLIYEDYEDTEIDPETHEEKRVTKTRTVPISGKIYEEIKSKLFTAVSNADPVRTAFLLEFITIMLDQIHDIAEFNDAMVYIGEKLQEIPLPGAQYTNASIVLEISLIRFFELLIDVYFHNTDQSVLDFLQENNHIIILFFQRFLTELQDDAVCPQLVPLIMNVMDFNHYDEIPMQIIAQDDSFFDLLFGIDIFTKMETGRSKKTREFFSSLFNLGYMMPDPSRVESMFDIIVNEFNKDPNNPLVYQMLSGASLCERLIFPHFLEMIRDKMAESIIQMIKKPDVPQESLNKLLRFIVIFSDFKSYSNRRLESFSSDAFFCYQFVCDTLNEYIRIMNDSDNSLTLYKIISRVLQVIKNIINWDCINIGVIEQYEETEFRSIILQILERIMLMPLSTLGEYPIFIARYMDFLYELLDQIPNIFFSLPSEIQHHQIEICKSILLMDDEESLNAAAKPFAYYISSSPFFNEEDQVPEDVSEEILNRCLTLLLINGSENLYIGEIIRISMMFKSEVVNYFLDQIKEQIPQEIIDDFIFHMRSFKDSIIPSVHMQLSPSDFDNEQMAKIVSSAHNVYLFLSKAGVSIQL